MSSLRKPADQTPLLQKLMLDGVNVAPSIKYNKKTQRRKSGTSRSIYWTEKPAISKASSDQSHYYYTALAIGATVVCSAGALMQHTETGGQAQPSDSVTSDNTIVQSEQLAATTTVVTPPISTSQTVASFSSQSNTSATNCGDGTCAGSELIAHPTAPQTTLPAQPSTRDSLQTTGAVKELLTQDAILVHRSTDLANRQATLENRSQELEQQFVHLTNLLAIHPDDAEYIASLLEEDTIYQVNRLLLNGLKDAIAVEYSKPVVDNPQLELLYSQYTHKMEKLRQNAQDALAIYIAEVSVDLPEPVWEDEEYYALLQELIDTAHFRQMHVVEQNTLDVMVAQLNQQRTELAVLLKAKPFS